MGCSSRPKSDRKLALTFVSLVSLVSLACGEEFSSSSGGEDGGRSGGSGVGGSGQGGSGVGGGSGSGGHSAGAFNGGTGGGSTGGSGGDPCASGGCPPLLAADLVNFDVTDLPGFNAAGFRCKSLSVCGASQACFYSSDANLGSRQSSEDVYTDGQTLGAPEAVKIQLQVGAASQCGDPPVSIAAGESILIKQADGQMLRIYFPALDDTKLLIYVRSDGATFYDAQLTDLAQEPL